MSGPIPRATYRLQLHRGFTFQDASALVPYLDALGVSHAYCSPYLRARAGSRHGYDIVDHSALNPEIGSRAELETFVAALRARNMGQILDMVPNHMGVGGDDNAWWLDVLEHGPASPCADFFDIDWHPLKEPLRGRLLLPLLGGHYGHELEQGALQLHFDDTTGTFHVRYYRHRFPLDPRSYGMVLEPAARAAPPLAPLAAAFAALPARSELTQEARQWRLRHSAQLKRELAALCRSAGCGTGLQAVLTAFNGRPGVPASFDALHQLLEAQVYRLAFWQVAADEINYRRFFDINELAGLRSERPEVMARTHQLVLELFRSGLLDGLRIDHPDGLYAPCDYLQRLRQAIDSAAPAGEPCYLVVEKVLLETERLPSDWPVHGTTGYDFAHLAAGLFVHPDGEVPLTRLFHHITGQHSGFDTLLYERKKVTIQQQLSSELAVLSSLLGRIAEGDRHTRDFTLNGLRDILIEVVASFPVYRTYVTPSGASAEDRRYIDLALALARRRNPATDASQFDFLRAVLLLDLPGDDARRGLAQTFAMKFQQYTAPVMAKALEDNVCYLYTRLLSLNEVGSLPRRFGVSLDAFHQANQERGTQWPHAMLATSTHDTKRGEDVRARLQVLSELPQLWRRHVGRWRRLNRRRKRLVNGNPAPSSGDEYLLYQTLAATWPLEPAPDWDGYAQRIRDYARKAAREAKLFTSWARPDGDYEAALDCFVQRALAHGHANRFRDDMATLVAAIAPCGLYTALSQVLLKLTAPGVPDLYQGSELWDFNLVDPDNRRPVDYAGRRAALADLQRRGHDRATLLPELLATLHDGRAKLYVIWQTLQLRRHHAALFRDGDYQPLAVEGRGAEHVCAFARSCGVQHLVVIAPRWYARLPGVPQSPPLGPKVWRDTCVRLPAALTARRLCDVFSGAEVTPDGEKLPLAEVLRRFPVALLHTGR